MNPCSFPKAMMLPVKVRNPRKTSNPSAPISRRDRCSSPGNGLRKSSVPPLAAVCTLTKTLTPTSAVASPAEGRGSNAIRSGIFVIGIRSEIAVPIPEPTMRAPDDPLVADDLLCAGASPRRR